MLHGVINIYKEPGFTSHDVVAKLRGICKQKKIGHTGTLDPAATGVLPVCLGAATKLCDFLTEKQKEYVAHMCLGITTDTQDSTGTVLTKQEVEVEPVKVEEVMASFVGPYEQLPPMYSALKVNGQKLYDLARQGVEVERKTRPVEILELEILEIDLPQVVFRAKVSKGTYIRTLCHDIGQALGCGAVMTGLERTKSGSFTKETAFTLAEVESMRDAGTLESHILPIDQVLQEFEPIQIQPMAQKLLDNGNPIPIELLNRKESLEDGKNYRIYGKENCFYGVYCYAKEEQRIRPVKMFFMTE